MTAYTLAEYKKVLATASLRIAPQMLKTMQRGGLNIRDDWRDRAAAKNPIHARKYASTVIMRRTIVSLDGLMTVTVEPGPWGQGKLGQVLEYGRGGSRNAPQASHIEALEQELPHILRWLSIVAADGVR